MPNSCINLNDGKVREWYLVNPRTGNAEKYLGTLSGATMAAGARSWALQGTGEGDFYEQSERRTHEEYMYTKFGIPRSP